MTSAPIAEGSTLGRCQLLGTIGRGSMGVVYRAYHTTLEMPVAVKVLNAPGMGPGATEWLERFRREAKIAARMNHPGLVRVFDFGEEGGIPYIVMELVQGRTLEAVIAERDPVGEHLALRIAGQIAVSLHAAHLAGIVHRDLKPANILIDGAGNLKIADLGLARDPHSAAITHPSGIAGTPHFMAPESIEAGGVTDHRADLYALGVILYRMLLGRLPYRGTLHQVLAGHLSGQPDWSVPEGKRLSPGSLYLMRRLLEKWPARRLQNAVEVVQACRELLARLDGQERVLAESARKAASEESTSSRISRALRKRLRAETSLSDGRRIVHATSTERILSAIALAVLAVLVLARLLR